MGLRLILRTAALFLLAAVCACGMGKPRTTPMEGLQRASFYNADMERLSDLEMADLLAGKRYALLGEAHDNPCDHEVQAKVLRLQSMLGFPPVVGLEMVARDRLDDLERFNRGEIGALDLPDVLDWNATWGHPFQHYLPIFETAVDEGLRLEPLNAPRDLTRKIGDDGLDALSPQERELVADRVVPPSEERREELRGFFELHKRFVGNATGQESDAELPNGKSHDQATGETLDETTGNVADTAPSRKNDAPKKPSFERFILVQSIWDSTMAESAVNAHRAYVAPVSVIAGFGHTRKGLGIGRRLEMFDPAGEMLVVSPWRGLEPPRADEGDVFYFCPNAHSSRLGYVLEFRSRGAFVSAVTTGGKAEELGFEVGDELVLLSGRRPKSPGDLREAGFEAARTGAAIEYVLEGPSGRRSVFFTPPPMQKPKPKPDEGEADAEAGDA